MSFFRFVFLNFILSSFIYANSSFAVIVSEDSKIKQISKKEISRIFLSKTKKLPNGLKAITVEPKEKSYQEYFYKEVCSKTKKRLKKYWATMIFTGRGQPPKKMKDTKSIVDFVKNNVNAIAYIPLKDARKNDVRIVLEVE